MVAARESPLREEAACSRARAHPAHAHQGVHPDLPRSAMRGVIFVMPVVQMLVFGYAVTTDVKHVRTAVLRPGQQRRQPRARQPLRGLGLLRRRGVRGERRTSPRAAGSRRGPGRPAGRPRASPTICGRPRRARPGDRGRHRLQHGRHRARLRRQDRRPALAGGADRPLHATARRRARARPRRSSRPAPGSTRTWRAATSTCPA